MRGHAKRDSNEATIMAELRQAGAQVIQLNGSGVPDLLVLWRNRLFVMEVKSRLGDLTIAQEAITAKGWPVWVVRSADDALHAIGAVLMELG